MAVTERARFTQADVTRALKGAKQAGFRSPRVILRPNGEIEIIGLNDPPEKLKGTSWDDLL